MKKISLLLFLTFLLLNPSSVKALSPVSQYMDLVAGEGDVGFRDGTFTSALFDHPTSGAYSEDKTKLFITDMDNNCIRSIDLTHQNNVSTLCGTREKGDKDGSLETATFTQPSIIISLPGQRLIVYEAGGQIFRLIDLLKKNVSTLTTHQTDGLPLGGVIDMVFDAKSNSLYFTQPSYQVLRKIDIATGENSIVLQKNPQLPSPGAICLFRDHLCVADTNLPSVYQVDATDHTPVAKVNLTEIAKGEKILNLTTSDNILYAFEGSDTPWVRLTSEDQFPTGEIKFMSLWGQFLEQKSADLKNLFNFEIRPGLTVAPGEVRKFLYIAPSLNQVLTLKDYAFFEFINGLKNEYPENLNGLTDFKYPYAKPPKTYRILMLGDSRIFYENENQDLRWPWGAHNRQETLPKKLEAMLNLQAAMDDVPIHFEVLTLGRFGWEGPLTEWPYWYFTNQIASYDPDSVILMMPNEFIMDSWFRCPYTKEGLPNILQNQDNEYLLKPMEEKLANQPLVKDLYERCLKRKWVSKDHWDFANLSQLQMDPDIFEDTKKMTTLLMKALNDKIKGYAVQKGHDIPFHMFFFPRGSVGAPVPIEVYRNFYKDICNRSGIDFEDLTDSWTALKVSTYPTSEPGANLHFDHNGHTIFAYLMTYYLIHHHLIPFVGQQN
jgi:hypothetical protein